MSHAGPARITACGLGGAILAGAVLVGVATAPPVPAPDQTDGALGDGVSVFDDRLPAIANLDPARHGPRYGLCRVYRNEPWHFELRRRPGDARCPAMYRDPAHDPRMQP